MNLKIKLFIRLVTVEFVKLRGTFAFKLSLLYPIGSVLLVTLFWISMRKAKEISTDQFISNLGNVAAFFLPFFIVLLVSVSCNTDHRSSMLKHILALPVSRKIFYLGKFAGIMLFVGIAFIATIACAYISLIICGLINSKLGFGVSFNHLLLVKVLLKGYLAASAIYSIQYWLGMRLRNLTLPVAIGSGLIILPIAIMIILGITGLITKEAEFNRIITYDPYSYPYSASFNFMKTPDSSLFPQQTLIFMLLSLVFLVFGIWEFNRRDIG